MKVKLWPQFFDLTIFSSKRHGPVYAVSRNTYRIIQPEYPPSTRNSPPCLRGFFGFLTLFIWNSSPPLKYLNILTTCSAIWATVIENHNSKSFYQRLKVTKTQKVTPQICHTNVNSFENLKRVGLMKFIEYLSIYNHHRSHEVF